MKRSFRSIASSAVLVFTIGSSGLLPTVTLAQTQEEQQAYAQKVIALDWFKAGREGDVAGVATFVATKNVSFLTPSDTDKFLMINGNPPDNGASNTIANLQEGWFAILKFMPSGLVKDDEKIDADALLTTLKDNSIKEAAERRNQGYSPLTVVGWAISPRYDSVNKRLEWATLLRDEDTQSLHANVSTKVLGRSGYTSVVLVTDSPETVERDLSAFKTAMVNFKYKDGERYSDWKQGDKVAAYGLGALVLGGAAAVATSKGGFKAIGLAILAGLVALWGVIKRLFGKKSDQ